MTQFEAWVTEYLVNSLWQVPLVFGAAWLAAGLLRRSGPGVEHRVWVTALGLQVALPAAAVVGWDRLRALAMLHGGGSDIGGGAIVVHMGPAAAVGGLHLPGAVLAWVAVGYGLGMAVLAVRLLRMLQATLRLRRGAATLELGGEDARFWSECCARFGIRGASLACSEGVPGPLTVGAVQPMVLLPAGVCAGWEREELRTVLAHELAHVSRKDFAKNLALQWISLPVKYHPLCWTTLAKISQTREEVCDEMAAVAVGGRRVYARSLLRLAERMVQGRPALDSNVIGIFDANSFERRITMLMNTGREMKGLRRTAVLALCGLAGLGTCVSAVALGTSVQVQEEPRSSKDVKVSAGVMAGQMLTRVNPIYPADAKTAKIQGTVVLRATIGKDGTMKEVAVLSGPEELTESALTAVRQWVYKPYLLNGEATEVETTIEVTYAMY